ncbi:MAG: amidohydrolase [Desulfobacter sp.]|nr:MAG: amidohydrolase [Desulfobacter sp.]
MPDVPEYILYNAKLHTLDDRFPSATALAVSASRITAVGGDEEILAKASPDTVSLDLEGRRVLPGFWDTHFHFFDWAKNLDSLELAGLKNFDGLIAMIRERARERDPGAWILGQGFNESDWPENRIPSRRDLDLAAPDHPVCIWRCDCHLAVANSMALASAGIDKAFSPPEGAVIDRDGSGEPTGILKELAPNLVSSRVPALTEAEIMDNLTAATSRLHSLGLTAVHDIRLMGGEDGAESLSMLQQYHGAGRLKLRCFVSLPGERVDEACDLGLTTGFGDDSLRIGWVKFFADGGMGARTGWMTEPYLDAGCGMPLTPVEEIERGVKKADRAGLSCMVHAIGDRACREMIAMFSRVEAAGRSRCRLPHRLEHIQMILPEDLGKMAQLKRLAASCQPNNLSLDISMIDQCAGERGKYAYALRPILDTGLPFMLSSDAPVADPSPFAGIYSAVTRKRMDNTPAAGWYPEHRLTLAEAVSAYTLTPAQVSGCGSTLGSLSPGKFADLVVLDRDIFAIDPDELAETRVEMTMYNGEIVHGV